MNNHNRLTYKVKEVAAMTGLSTKTIYNRIKEGIIRPVGYCRHILILAEDVDRLISLERPEPVRPWRAKDDTCPCCGQLKPISSTSFSGLSA
jgi:excisionase family DNA binding protein